MPSYVLNEELKRLVVQVVNQHMGSFQARPKRTRRVRRGSGGGGGTVKARVYTTITAAAGPAQANWGSGQVKLQDPSTGVVASSPTSVDNDNIGTSFDVDCQVTLDQNYSPPRVIGGSCSPVDWGD